MNGKVVEVELGNGVDLLEVRAQLATELSRGNLGLVSISNTDHGYAVIRTNSIATTVEEAAGVNDLDFVTPEEAMNLAERGLLDGSPRYFSNQYNLEMNQYPKGYVAVVFEEVREWFEASNAQEDYYGITVVNGCKLFTPVYQEVKHLCNQVNYMEDRIQDMLEGQDPTKREVPTQKHWNYQLANQRNGIGRVRIGTPGDSGLEPATGIRFNSSFNLGITKSSRKYLLKQANLNGLKGSKQQKVQQMFDLLAS